MMAGTKNGWMAKVGRWSAVALVAVWAGAAQGEGVALPWEVSGKTLAEFWEPGDEWVLELGGEPARVEYQVVLLDRMTNGVGSTEMGCLVLEAAPADGEWNGEPLAEIATADLIEGIGGDGVWLKARRAPDGAARRLQFRMATEGGGLGFALRGVRVAGGAERPRMAFDRAGGFTVGQGTEASVTARVENGGGYGISRWEGNAPGHAEGRRNGTWVIDTAEPGEYWLRAVGWCDGTDGEVRGTIRFRVAEPPRAARAAGEGEEELLNEDFSGMTSGSGTDVGTSGYNGWTGEKMFNGTNCLKIGSSKATGHAVSPVVTNAGSAGRVEYTLRAYGSDSTAVALECSTDGNSWNSLTNHTGMPSEATSYSVDFGASQRVQFKWTGSGKRFHLGPVAVYAAGGGGGTTASNEPPTIDLEPADTAVALMVGDTYSLEVVATEFEGDEITLSADGLPEDAIWYPDDPKTGSAMGLFEWTPETTGSWSVVFAAADKDGTNTATVVFTVEPEGPGRLEFASEGVNVRESAGSVSLTVARRGGALGTVGVRWATADGTASAGSEYTAGSGTLSFADGETSKTLTVAILDDTAAEENKSFTVTLGNVTGGATLGNVATCTVTIVDDDDANASYYASCYKNGVLKTGDELKSTLCRILNTGTTTNDYSRVDNILDVIDVPEGASQVRCLYAQTGVSAFNREHIWAQSHGIDESLPGYSDLHHIRACTESLNSKRSDKDFDNCQGVSGAGSSMGCYYTSSAFEPPDAAKGDVARACFYMAVRYQGQYHANANLELVDWVGTTSTGNQLGKLGTLLAWHELDPVDDFERKRNEKIYTTYQHNRNPFIDHPTWVTAVFDPDHFQEETITWTVNVTVEGAGWVNNQSGAFTAELTNGLTKTFNVVPDASAYHHIGSISWNGAVVPQAYYTNAAYYNYTCPAVTNNATLAVVFAPDTAALGTPVWWLVQYGTNSTAVTQEDWDAAELEDWNDDGVPNWQEYLNGSDPTALSLRQVTGVTVTATNNTGFTLSWNAVDYADGYRVRVCPTTVVDAASAGFEGGAADAGWTVSASGATVAANAALDGTYGLAFSTNGAWLASPTVANPASVEFKYKRSGNNDAWTLAVEVSADGRTTWTEAGRVTNATTTAKTGSVDLSAWYGQTVIVRLRDARESGNAARYVDAVTVKTGGATVAEATTSATAWTATGLDAGTGYDVSVRGEATTLGTAVGPWSAVVRATTLPGEDNRQEQNITFPPIADQLTTATVTLQATASSGLAVSYAVDGPALLDGAVLSFTGAGTVTVTASQDGNAEWKPAPSVTHTFMVTEPELAAPSAVWASATNAMDFTATWSPVDGATGYELSVWTQTAGGSVAVTNETVLFSTAFEDITGNGNARLNADAIAGWTFTNAFAATNEIKVGVSGAGGAVTSATYTAVGTLRVVTEAHAWGNDGTVLWVGATGQTAQSNQLDAASGRFTNTFEGVDGEVAVSWTTTAGKKRFLLEAVEISVLAEGEGEGGGEIVPADGYDVRPVEGTSCAVTGLVAETTYFFQVRATAGAIVGPWSDAASVTTLAEEPGPGPEPEPGTPEAYEAWLAEKVGSETAAELPYATADSDDFDGDGVSNWDEYVCDTDPADKESYLRLEVELQPGGSWLAKPVPASTNRSYSLVSRTDLIDDATLATNTLGVGTAGIAVTNSMPGGGIWFGSIRATLGAGE